MISAKAMAMLAAAIETDHPCEDRGCDIAVSLSQGFVLASAQLLTGATETPSVDAVVRRYRIALGTVHSPEFQAWVTWHHNHKRQCPDCEGFMYEIDGDEPGQCSNCLAPLPAHQDATADEFAWDDTWGFANMPDDLS